MERDIVGTDPKITSPSGRIMPDGFTLKDGYSSTDSSSVTYTWDWARGGWVNGDDGKVYNFEWQGKIPHLHRFSGPYPHLAAPMSFAKPLEIVFPDGTLSTPTNGQLHDRNNGQYEWRQADCGWWRVGDRTAPGNPWKPVRTPAGPYHFDRGVGSLICMRKAGPDPVAVAYFGGAKITLPPGVKVSILENPCKDVKFRATMREETMRKELAFFTPPRTTGCECGAWAAKSNTHSSWCKMFKEPKEE